MLAFKDSRLHLPKVVPSMTARPDPGGFPQRRIAEVPSVSSIEMREIQRIAQEDYGLDILQIMENAGRSVAALAMAMLGGRGRGQRIVVLAGGGNKGGAGLCAARHLVNWGFNVEPVFGQVESEGSFAARRQIKILREGGIVEPHDQATSEITVEEHLHRADLVIDALVGYGLEGSPTGIAAALVEIANASRRPILAIDVPTGITATSGDICEPAIRAATTLMLDLPKRGLLRPQCRHVVGEMYLADVGIPRQLYQRLGVTVGQIFSEGPIVRLKR